MLPYLAVGGWMRYTSVLPYLTVGGWECTHVVSYLVVDWGCVLCSHTLPLFFVL